MDLRGLHSPTVSFVSRNDSPSGHEMSLNEHSPATSQFASKQWLAGKDSEEQENIWVPVLKRNSPIPYKGALVSSDTLARDFFPFRSTLPQNKIRPGVVPDKIVATTRTTQTLAQNYEYKDLSSLRRSSGVSSTTISAAHSSLPTPEEGAFSLEMVRDTGPDIWHQMSSSASLDIIEDYQDEILLDELEVAREPPSSLPPVPSLPAPSVGSDSFYPRGPQTIEELEARGLRRHVSNDSTTSNDPLDPASHSPITLPPVRAVPPRTLSLMPATKTKKASHQKSSSQSRLLPLHLNQAPCLTTDKPTLDEERHSRMPDCVQIHWLLLITFTAFPPLWLVLASGTLDELLHVPMYPVAGRIDSLASNQRRVFLRVRRVKHIAMALGLTFWTICFAGMLTGLILA